MTTEELAELGVDVAALERRLAEPPPRPRGAHPVNLTDAGLDDLEQRAREFEGCEDPSHVDQKGVVTQRPDTYDVLALVAEVRRLRCAG